MPQEEADIREANKKKKGVLADGKVLPKEDTEVWSTGKGKHLGKRGTSHIVHRVLVDKLVASGQVTTEEPDETFEEDLTKGVVTSLGKPVVLTDSEIADLTAELGKEPTRGQLAAALTAKRKALADSEEL